VVCFLVAGFLNWYDTPDDRGARSWVHGMGGKTAEDCGAVCECTEHIVLPENCRVLRAKLLTMFERAVGVCE